MTVNANRTQESVPQNSVITYGPLSAKTVQVRISNFSGETKKMFLFDIDGLRYVSKQLKFFV